MITVITAATSDAARAKLEDYRSYVSEEGALVLMSGWTVLASQNMVLTEKAAPLAEVGVVNRGVVELETARAAGISVRIAEDLAKVIDDGATRRVLPVIGKGTLQNITDLKLLRGIDMAIVQTDVLDYARQQNLFPGIENWATYITKL
jgi:hypothetical protein